MRKSLQLILAVSVMLLSACDVHEWPEAPQFVQLHLRLGYETDMVEWHHLYEDASIVEQRLGTTYNNQQSSGTIRYVVRTYPAAEKQRSTQEYVQQFVFTKDIAEGYNHAATLDLLPGNYNIKVWSDIVESSDEEYVHDVTTFAQIRLLGSHKGNTDYRDAFRGSADVLLESSTDVRQPDTLDVVMQRPLAKFEFITNDVDKFIGKEATRAAASAESVNPADVNIEEYKVVFHYVGFMPNAYSIATDKPVDSATGVTFESSLQRLSDTEAKIGFDYLFVGHEQAAVTVQIGVYDGTGAQLSLTEPIEVPIKRNHHTIMKGMFLMSDAEGGVAINPDFNGNHNLVIQ